MIICTSIFYKCWSINDHLSSFFYKCWSINDHLSIFFINVGILMIICTSIFYKCWSINDHLSIFLYLVKLCNSEPWQMAISWAIYFGSVLWIHHTPDLRQWVEKGNKYCLQNCPVKSRLVMQNHKLTNNSFCMLYIKNKLRVTKGDTNTNTNTKCPTTAACTRLATTFGSTMHNISLDCHIVIDCWQIILNMKCITYASPSCRFQELITMADTSSCLSCNLQ